MNRRAFLASAAAGLATTTVPSQAGEAPTFKGFETVALAAETLAAAPYRGTAAPLAPVYADAGYDAYRGLRYRADRRLWRDEGRGFTVDALPSGWLFRQPVEIGVVEDGLARPLPFDPTALDPDPTYFPDGLGDASGFWTGLRVRFPINRPEVDDEVLVFQGGSYFRAVGRGHLYGLSARALALRTASPQGEEFPAFTRFWLERPQERATELRLWALLDGPSLSGAYEFLLRPGAETTMDVRSRLFARETIAEAGVAPLTSMYYFGDADRRGVDDHRDAAHDSEGLQALTGRDERLWRPLTNPATLQVSAFVDHNPHGFGLAQRAREFRDYADAEARYDLRPSTWVQPQGDWGDGAVTLVEIPTNSEFNDNIVAFWRPAAPIEAGAWAAFDYRLVWSSLPPDAAPMARVVATREGAGVNRPDRRVIAVDFQFDGAPPEGVAADAEVRGAALDHVGLTPLPGDGRLRAGLSFAPPDQGVAEFRLVLRGADGAALSETWLFRWTAS